MTDQIRAEPADTSDPKVAADMKRSLIVAREALGLMAKRYRKRPPEEALTMVTNTIGVIAAELIGEAVTMERDLDLVVAKHLAKIMTAHIENALERRGAKP